MRTNPKGKIGAELMSAVYEQTFTFIVMKYQAS